MNAREGDLIETKNSVIFDVKGLMHPPNKIVAFIRYVPDPRGNRERKGRRYSKYYALSKRYELLKREYPHYLVDDPVFNTLVCEVPKEEINYHYQPAQGLQDLRNSKNPDPAETAALQSTETIKEHSGVQWSKIGVSGSILVKLHEPTSDIDLIVYGSKSGYKVAATMKELLEDTNTPFEAYGLDGLRKLFDFRSKDTHVSFEDFVRTESRKTSHGMYMDRHFFIRYVKDHSEITEQYGDVIYKTEGSTTIEATIADDSQSLFTPCTYKLANLQILKGTKAKPIKEIVSFRGRFCEQARNGEKVIARGKLESVHRPGTTDHFRLLVGNNPSDNMILVQ